MGGGVDRKRLWRVDWERLLGGRQGKIMGGRVDWER